MTDMQTFFRKSHRTQSASDHSATPLAVEHVAFLKPEHALLHVKSSRQGLTTEEAGKRLKEHGLNEVAHEKAPLALVQFVQAFNNPFIYVLMALAAVSAVTDVWLPQRQGEDIDVTGVVIIMTIITLSGVLRFWQKFRTNRAAQSLKSMVRITTTVLRRASDNVSPVQTLLPVEELVPGDVIVLSAGDLVPADFRLLEARDLFVSQSILSRESLPVEKADVVAVGRPRLHDHTPPPERKADLLELNTICLMGTNVTSGCALAVVVATGKHTWSGTLAKPLVGTL